LNIHEYQAKELLRKFDISTPNGQIVESPEEAFFLTKSFGGTSILKAQVHAGGRGKAGGVKFARSPEEAKSLFNSIMGMTLISPQTGPQGKIVRKVYISDPVDIDREFYLSILVDRKTGRVAVIGRGGRNRESCS
jgi:succinyl-CoA synthetase beta subunit